MRLLVLGAYTGVVCALVGIGSTALAVCRVVEPSQSQGVRFDPRTTVLVVQAPDQLTGYECPEDVVAPEPIGIDLEGWIGDQTGQTSADGGVRARFVSPSEDDAGLPKTSDAGLEMEEERLCEDGRPALEVRGPLVHVMVQPGIYADGGTAGLIMPVPRRADVNVAPNGVMRALQSLPQATRIRETIEFVEDPSLGYQCSDPHYSAHIAAPSPAMLFGCGGSDEGFYRPGLEGMDTNVVEYRDGSSVEVEEIPVNSDYTVTVLNASSLSALIQWLDDNEFEYDATDEAAFARYVGQQRWFVAVKVHPQALGGAHQVLEPIVVSYRGTQFPVTHEISYEPEGGIIETDLWVMAEHKMAVEDGDARTEYSAPFALQSTHAALEPFGLSSGWLTRLQLERNMSDALKRDTELIVADNTDEIRNDFEEVTTRVRIAQACCAGNAIPGSGPRTFTEVREYDLWDRPDDTSLFYRAPPAEQCAPSPAGDFGYVCAVAGSAWSWSPLLMAMWIISRRRRRRRRAS